MSFVFTCFICQNEYSIPMVCIGILEWNLQWNIDGSFCLTKKLTLIDSLLIGIGLANNIPTMQFLTGISINIHSKS